jgi:6-carboxyhexanoate--CoA ligase
MNNLWSIRMRASKNVRSQKSEVRNRKLKKKNQKSKLAEIHISGAEGLYEVSDIQEVIKKYTLRALNHPKGMADKIIFTIEDIKRKPKEISALPLATISCRTPDEGKNAAIKLLQPLGISKKAIATAFELIEKSGMRGAAIITAEKGDRLEPDIERGVRASRFGVDRSALKTLSLRLSRHGINKDIVKEALILASKVISFRHAVAELCISDDPYYTTGYVASKRYGYLRITNIKHKRSKSGGRAFFVKEGINVKGMINYLERTPVIIKSVSLCRGTVPIDEILNFSYK